MALLFFATSSHLNQATTYICTVCAPVQRVGPIKSHCNRRRATFLPSQRSIKTRLQHTAPPNLSSNRSSSSQVNCQCRVCLKSNQGIPMLAPQVTIATESELKARNMKRCHGYQKWCGNNHPSHQLMKECGTLRTTSSSWTMTSARKIRALRTMPN